MKNRPFLRWAGGKSWLLIDLKFFLPENYNKYHEPFLGGGSVFFYLNPENNSYLSDYNKDLINTYLHIRDNVEDVFQVLETFKNTKSDYYSIRNLNFDDNISRAAQFIYLNRTSFNGIYRVNQNGQYNVPYGYKKYKSLIEYDIIKSASKALVNSQIRAIGFEETLPNIVENDLVFLDPPYTHSHVKNGFINYNEKLFSWEDQVRLSKFITRIKNIGAFYILTNANHDSIKELYSNEDKPFILNRISTIGGKNAKRRPIQELLYTNVPYKNNYHN